MIMLCQTTSSFINGNRLFACYSLPNTRLIYVLNSFQQFSYSFLYSITYIFNCGVPAFIFAPCVCFFFLPEHTSMIWKTFYPFYFSEPSTPWLAPRMQLHDFIFWSFSWVEFSTASHTCWHSKHRHVHSPMSSLRCLAFQWQYRYSWK